MLQTEREIDKYLEECETFFNNYKLDEYSLGCVKHLNNWFNDFLKYDKRGKSYYAARHFLVTTIPAIIAWADKLTGGVRKDILEALIALESDLYKALQRPDSEFNVNTDQFLKKHNRDYLKAIVL